MKTAAVILAGGQSRRMGHDKRRLRLWGTDGPTLLEHIIQQVAPLCAELIVVLNDATAWPTLAVRTVADWPIGAGPLAGLVGGFTAIEAEQALVLAADMPFIAPALLRLLRDWPDDADRLIPLRTAGPALPRNAALAEPLLARYHRRCLPLFQAALAAGEHRVSAPFPALRTTYLPAEIWQPADPSGRSFINLNRPEDLAALTNPATPTEISSLLPIREKGGGKGAR